jgi:hypothetical protein
VFKNEMRNFDVRKRKSKELPPKVEVTGGQTDLHNEELMIFIIHQNGIR